MEFLPPHIVEWFVVPLAMYLLSGGAIVSIFFIGPSPTLWFFGFSAVALPWTCLSNDESSTA